MLGRLNRTYKLSLLPRLNEQSNQVTYDIVTRKVQSKGSSRLQKVGEIQSRSQYSMVKIDIKKLYHLISTTRLQITGAVWKAFGIFGEQKKESIRERQRNSLEKRLMNKKITAK